jgi:hypothetical protein
MSEEARAFRSKSQLKLMATKYAAVQGATVVVNVHGALIRTVKPLEVGSTVYLKTSQWPIGRRLPSFTKCRRVQ